MVRRLASILAVLALAGCARTLAPLGADNRPPDVVLSGPATPPVRSGDDVLHSITWHATDPDGRVDHFLVLQQATPPRGDEPGWSVTRDQAWAVRVRRAPIMAAGEHTDRGRAPTFVGVRAVDDRGAMSPPALRAYFAENVAPSVVITLPRPSPAIVYTLPPTIRIHWQGADPDAPDQRPVAYKYKVIPESELAGSEVRNSRGDLIRTTYAPAFTGWTTVPADSEAATITGLELGAAYTFAITAIDADGDYDPVFLTSKNVLTFLVGSPAAFGPGLRFFNDFYYGAQTWIGTDPDRLPDPVTAPADVALTMRWSAMPPPGADIVGYRWVLDPANVDDPTTRTSDRDLAHWSPWSFATSATFGPFHGHASEVPHTLYVEAADNLGLRTRGAVRFYLVRGHASRDLLIVDDTRLLPDMRSSGGALLPPGGSWPTAAELDTFLYARGGVEWQGYPSGTMSSPGLFAGYAFDTLGTRTGSADPTVPLDVLMRYRHVIWIVDRSGALSTTSSLRFMSAPGRTNTLAAYLARGGDAWVVGGAAGYASTIAYNRSDNDVSGATVFSSAPPRTELAPSRFLFDHAHWQSEFRSGTSTFLHLDRIAVARGPGAPDYSLLPATMGMRSAATDPLPPYRFASSFYNTVAGLEFLSMANTILEDVATSPRQDALVPVLDTLMVGRGSGIPTAMTPAPTMTYYHGAEGGAVLFSGFDLWSWRRADCAALVDGVLQGIWHLQKAAPPAVTATAASSR